MNTAATAQEQGREAASRRCGDATARRPAPRCANHTMAVGIPPGPVTYPWGGVASLKRGLMFRSCSPPTRPASCSLPPTYSPRRAQGFRGLLASASNVQADNRTLKELLENFRAWVLRLRDEEDSAHYRPRVRSLAAFGRRAPCTWLLLVRSGRSANWLNSKKPACEAVRREAEEDWGR